MTSAEYQSSLDKIEKLNSAVNMPPKIRQTIDLLVEFLKDITPVIFDKSNVLHKIMPVLKFVRIGRLSYHFIISLIKIWK
jgi:hypothetical protein